MATAYKIEEANMTLTLDDVGLLFSALPDEHQIRLLAYLMDRMSIDTDGMHDALRGMAEEVSGFTSTDNYYDLLRADEIYPPAMHSRLARELFKQDRDGKLAWAMTRAQVRRAA